MQDGDARGSAVVELDYPFPRPPANGGTLEIAPGLHWLRMPLPFRLDHVNLYLVEDEGGWTIVDAGVDTPEARALWEGVLAGLLAGKPVRRLIVTHYHPDHVGAAAWLCRRTGAELLMGETEYLTARVHRLATGDDLAGERDFYAAHGLAPAALDRMAERLDRYRAVVPALPGRYAPLRAGDRLQLGPFAAEVVMLPGHSPAQVLLHVPAHELLFAADHVLAQISPNVSVAEDKPGDDPLGRYVASLRDLPARVPDRTLVLPGHRLPFFGLHRRCAELVRHHEARCADLARFCDAAAPLTAAEIVPRLFTMELDAHQFWFAFSETLAHVNMMARQGALEEVQGEGGVRRWRRAADPRQ
jgi:glyoxylase-like metal-dependent hydrolase (beta-lactamase superfamily II)